VALRTLMLQMELQKTDKHVGDLRHSTLSRAVEATVYHLTMSGA